jgi:alkylation response protein AidB-like acyl-CoA dehydrogenase
MDFSFSEEQQAVRELAGQIFADHADPKRLRKLESSAEGIDRELWSALARANLLGIPLPEDHDGSDLGLIATLLLLEEQGPLLATLILGAMPIAEFGSNRQKQRWLPGVVSGEVLLSAALTEVAAWDPAQPRVTATSDGPDWRLEGEKICVPAGALAERILVPARTGAKSVGVFLLDPTSDGVATLQERATNREAQVQLVLSGARVCADDVLGDPAGGSAIVAWIEARALLGLCAIQVGVAAEALRRTAEYAGIRKQFGRQIGAFQGVSLRAADAYIDIEAMRSTLLQAAWRLDDGRPAEVEVHAAKWWACRGGQRVVHTAQHIHGGIGADVDYPIHRYLLWSKQLDLTLGGAAPQLARLGRLVALGEEAGAPGVEASGK